MAGLSREQIERMVSRGGRYRISTKRRTSGYSFAEDAAVISNTHSTANVTAEDAQRLLPECDNGDADPGLAVIRFSEERTKQLLSGEEEYNTTAGHEMLRSLGIE
jgi:hypothetical protein